MPRETTELLNGALGLADTHRRDSAYNGTPIARPRKILLADDEAYITCLVATKLRRLGDEVVVASDGGEAFALACQEMPDLVITDFQMPSVNGFEFACRLRENPATAEIPIIMLTARGHLLSPTELAKTNIKMLIAKPFSAKELLSKAEELIGAPRSLQTTSTAS